MDTQPTIYVLSDAELDAVTGGKKGGGGGGGGETAEIVEISIGEIVAVGNSTVTLDVVTGGGNNNSGSSGRHNRR